MKKDDFIFGPYDPQDDTPIEEERIWLDTYRCECCGEYFDSDEGEWIDNNFFCKPDLEQLDRDEMKTRTGEIPTFKSDKP